MTSSNFITRDSSFLFFERLMHHRPANLSPREKAIYDHYPLVIKIASQFRDQGLELTDLVAAGLTGLVLAYDRYDPASGHRFTTFAVPWIRGEITSELTASGHLIHQTWRSRKLIRRILHEQQQFAQLYDRYPTAEELSELLSIPADRIVALLSANQSFIPLNSLPFDSLPFDSLPLP